jgi:hypothetical protein
MSAQGRSFIRIDDDRGINRFLLAFGEHNSVIFLISDSSGQERFFIHNSPPESIHVGFTDDGGNLRMRQGIDNNANSCRSMIKDRRKF